MQPQPLTVGDTTKLKKELEDINVSCGGRDFFTDMRLLIFKIIVCQQDAEDRIFRKKIVFNVYSSLRFSRMALNCFKMD